MHVCAGLLKYAGAESWNFLVCLKIKLVKVEISTCIQDIQSYYETGLSARWLVQTFGIQQAQSNLTLPKLMYGPS